MYRKYRYVERRIGTFLQSTPSLKGTPYISIPLPLISKFFVWRMLERTSTKYTYSE